MDTKRTIAERIHTIVPELDQEQIVNLLEVPKILTWGPCLSSILIGSNPS